MTDYLSTMPYAPPPQAGGQIDYPVAYYFPAWSPSSAYSASYGMGTTYQWVQNGFFWSSPACDTDTNNPSGGQCGNTKPNFMMRSPSGQFVLTLNGETGAMIVTEGTSSESTLNTVGEFDDVWGQWTTSLIIGVSGPIIVE